MGHPFEQQPSSTLARLLSLLVLTSWIGSLLFHGNNDGLLLPYAWWDVAAVAIASGIPLAWLIVSWSEYRLCNQSVPPFIAVGVGITLLAAFRLGFWNVTENTTTTMLEYGNITTRIAAALLASLGIVCTLLSYKQNSVGSAEQDSWHANSISWLFAILLLMLVPMTYERAKLHSSEKRAFELLDQSRLAEASQLLKRCLLLDPESSFRGRSIQSLIDDLEERLATIQLRAVHPLPDDSLPPTRIERAIDLAVLGKREDALLLLLPVAQQPTFAMNGGHELLGTLYQDRHEWKESLFHFQLASEFWRSKQNSELRKARLAQSLQGEAFALRKLGRIDQAEAAYLRLVEIQPTAERHFLLAQFYEDIQETSLASQHANLAAELAPNQFRESSKALISKMRTNHFGCFQLFNE